MNAKENLKDLSDRVQRGAYKAVPGLRKYIPKADGSLRPSGTAALEDKTVRQTVAEILSAICEADFSEYSCGSDLAGAVMTLWMNCMYL
jgi:retron-type reverse transcriptase